MLNLHRVRVDKGRVAWHDINIMIIEVAWTLKHQNKAPSKWRGQGEGRVHLPLIASVLGHDAGY